MREADDSARRAELPIRRSPGSVQVSGNQIRRGIRPGDDHLAMVAHHLLSLNDLFVIGLALDLTGGVLLAKGLLVSGHAIKMRTSTCASLNPYLAVSVAEDRVEAATGLGVLGCGFTTQLVGYLLTLALEPNRLAPSIATAIAALALVVLAVGIVLAARALIRPVAVRRTLVQVARSEQTVSWTI